MTHKLKMRNPYAQNLAVWYHTKHTVGSYVMDDGCTSGKRKRVGAFVPLIHFTRHQSAPAFHEKEIRKPTESNRCVNIILYTLGAHDLALERKYITKLVSNWKVRIYCSKFVGKERKDDSIGRFANLWGECETLVSTGYSVDLRRSVLVRSTNRLDHLLDGMEVPAINQIIFLRGKQK